MGKRWVWLFLGVGLLPLEARGQVSSPATSQPATYLSIDPALAPAAELLLFQDMPQVVFAGRYGQFNNQIPAVASVVNADDIEIFGYRSLADVLRNQRGFYIHNDGFNWYAGERGFLRAGEYNARMLVLVDGRPTRDTNYGQSHLDLDFEIPMEIVDRVEIVRAPGSGLYGGSAVFSVVNLVTKSGADINGAQVRLTGGTKDTGRASIVFGKLFPDDWDVVASVNGYTSEGDRTIHFSGVNDAASNFGFIRHNDDEQVESAFLKVRHGELTLEADYATHMKENRTNEYFNSWFDPGRAFENRAAFSARIDHDLGDGQSLHAMAAYGHYGYHETDPYTWGDPPESSTYFSNAVSDWLTAEVNYDWKVNKQLHILAGADGNVGIRNHQYNTDTTDGKIIDINPSYSAWGLFAEADYQVNDWLSLSGGLRVNGTLQTGIDIAPRAAVIISPDRDDTIKLLYGRAFRMPNLYEMHYQTQTVFANPNLRPEVCDTYEALWERNWGDEWHTSTGPFFWIMSHSIDDVVDADGNDQPRNVGAQHALGFEAEIEKHWANGARLRAYATVNRAEKDDQTLTLSPAWTAGAALAFPVINGRTFLAIEPQIVGPQKNDRGQYANPTFVTNVVLTSKDVLKGLDLQLGVYNIFGEFARMPAGSSFDYSQPFLNYPTTEFLFTVTYRF